MNIKDMDQFNQTRNSQPSLTEHDYSDYLETMDTYTVGIKICFR